MLLHGPCVTVYVCVSVTLVHPAKAIGWNEMSFGSDTCEVLSNIMLEMSPVPHGKSKKENF